MTGPADPQAQVRVDAAVLAQEGAVQTGRVLLEEEEGREDHQGGPHEAQGPGHGGGSILTLHFSEFSEKRSLYYRGGHICKR